MFCKTNIYSVGLVVNKSANSNSERVYINIIFNSNLWNQRPRGLTLFSDMLKHESRKKCKKFENHFCTENVAVLVVLLYRSRFDPKIYLPAMISKLVFI